MAQFKFHQQIRDHRKASKLKADFRSLTDSAFAKKYCASFNEVRAWAKSQGLRKNAAHHRRIRSQNARHRHATLCAHDGKTVHRIEIRRLPRGENLCDLAADAMIMACGKSLQPKMILYAQATCAECLAKIRRPEKVKKRESKLS